MNTWFMDDPLLSRPQKNVDRELLKGHVVWRICDTVNYLAGNCNRTSEEHPNTEEYKALRIGDRSKVSKFMSYKSLRSKVIDSMIDTKLPTWTQKSTVLWKDSKTSNNKRISGNKWNIWINNKNKSFYLRCFYGVQLERVKIGL